MRNLLFVYSLLWLTACNGGESNSTPAPSGSTPATTSPKATAATHPTPSVTPEQSGQWDVVDITPTDTSREALMRAMLAPDPTFHSLREKVAALDARKESMKVESKKFSGKQQGTVKRFTENGEVSILEVKYEGNNRTGYIMQAHLMDGTLLRVRETNYSSVKDPEHPDPAGNARLTTTTEEVSHYLSNGETYKTITKELIESEVDGQLRNVEKDAMNKKTGDILQNIYQAWEAFSTSKAAYPEFL